MAVLREWFLYMPNFPRFCHGKYEKHTVKHFLECNTDALIYIYMYMHVYAKFNVKCILMLLYL